MVLGIGNPGPQYQKNLHNIGFMILETLASQWKLSFEPKIPRCLVAKKEQENQTILLLKPITYVNGSGQVLDFFWNTQEEKEKFIENFLVICDDVYLPLGKLRFRKSGTSGGHNGLKSLEAILGAEYQRLRVGVNEGNPQESDLKEIVLSDFSPHHQERLEAVLKMASESVQTWLEAGINVTMNRFNGVSLHQKVSSKPPNTFSVSSPSEDLGEVQ